MPQAHRAALLIPLVVGTSAIILTIFVHAIAVGSTVTFVRRETRLGHASRGFWSNVLIVAAVITIALAAHLTEMALWGMLFLLVGEFSGFQAAFNHSAVNYTTLGYGDVIMSPAWSLLGPLEAADGMLMFGVSTAMIFAVIQRLVRARFADLRDSDE
jgi:hypothetical protein